MISFEVFLFALMIVSVLTGLVTEAVKTALNEHKISYHANTLAGVVAGVLALLICIAYAVVSDTGFTSQMVVCSVALILMSWLCAMVGYDKVIQAIAQFKTGSKGDVS